MKNSLLIFIILLFCFTLCYLASENTIVYLGYPLIYQIFILTFLVQFIVFLPSYYYQTEHYYDLTGGLTFISVILFSLYAKYITLGLDLRSTIIGLMIIIWALRLSSFLFLRVKKVGEDIRFKEIKKSFSRFLIAFTLQGFWVFMCTFPALIVLTSSNFDPDIFLIFGSILWLFGFLYEVIADKQKSNFNIKNKGKFISSGLWSLSRHPNYFGEITLWTGITIISITVLSGFQYLALLTPFFIYRLLNNISGVNFLEDIGNKRWGSEKEYQTYIKETPKFFPKIFNF
tara:strand:- start:1096 stop:1956 length:861 start_codon:yes stop_codon:yes gene_type:complete